MNFAGDKELGMRMNFFSITEKAMGTA